MKLKEIYEKAYKTGMELDPRGSAEVLKELECVKKDYDGLKEKARKDFDVERLSNPYADTRVLYGDLDTEVNRILLGIDMEVGEVLLADRLKEKGRHIDLIVSHHPEGKALANLYAVMDMQAGILYKYGVPINVAEGIMSERISEVERRLMPANHTRAVDAARLLGIPIMCIHTPSDNAVTDYLQRLFDDKKPFVVSDIIDMLREIPEYAEAVRDTIAPKIVSGSDKRKAGKVFVDMTGGTGGSKKAFKMLANSGVGTVVGMHISEDHLKEAKEHNVNVIIAGHISSDTLGMNLLLDRILTPGVEVIGTSGFKRHERKQS
jgi:putative NIF3 family GTP cyclohydrolase 1 type 2